MAKRASRLIWLVVATLLCAGCIATTPSKMDPPAEATATQVKNELIQDPALAITTLQVAELLSGPDADNYLIVDARPANKFQAGHVPGAINLPKALLSQNLDKLSNDKTIIFYCGGLHCKLSPQAAEIALQNGFSKVKVWYEGMPGWLEAGNYAEIETEAIEKLVMTPGQEPFVLIDARPAVKYQQAFIPSALSLPKAEFELKKGLLPADKSIPLIFYCGGAACELSHLSAKKAQQLGYTKVLVYAAGAPAWKEAGLPFWGNQASGKIAEQAPSQALPEAIAADEFTQLWSAGKLTVVDVRSAEDFAVAHINGAINIYDEDFIFKAADSVAKLPETGRVVLYCATGGRAGGAYYAILGESDYANKDNLQYLDATIEIATDGSFKIAKSH